jgi:hypothetical protein
MGNKKSNAEKKALNTTKDYYTGKNEDAKKGGDIKLDAAQDTNKSTVRDANKAIGDIGDSLALVLKGIGYKEGDINQDFIKVAGRLAEDKATGLENIDYWTKTNSARTQEDLDTSLEKENRRYEIQTDRNNLDMTAKNQVFSGFGGVRGEIEGRASDQNQSNVKDVKTVAARSFQDIQRDEFAKTQAVMQAYTRGEKDATDTKDRGLRDLVLTSDTAKLGANQQIATQNNNITDANTTLDNSTNATNFDTGVSIRGNNYGLADDSRSISNSFKDDAAAGKQADERKNSGL